MEISLVYPHQLFLNHPALKPGRAVYLIEEPLILTHNPIHTQKLLLHRLSLKAYETHLIKNGYQVTYLEISNLPTTEAVFSTLKQHGVTTIHVADTTDDYLEQALETAKETYDFTYYRYESPLFILPKEEAITRYKNSRRYMAKFYKQLRIDKNILMEGAEPYGGKFSFDEENRQKLPNGIALPDDISFYENEEILSAKRWLASCTSERYGAENVWLPYTHHAAKAYLKTFLRDRLTDFGAYEDAMTSTHTRLFHSTLSPLINIGLLTPHEVLEATLAYAKEHSVPLNSLEGFVRQILGWREFIRAAYEADGRIMRSKNFFKHTRPLPKGSWDGTTDIAPLDLTIERCLVYGYSHHIERLMVAGNFFLTKTNPDEVYRWFMGMYVDAYDWVIVPDVYGMSQFADGGLFATKPYISGASYLKKMSDYKKGEWEDIWTALYWNFIDTHKAFFSKNHRLSMMPKLLEKMSPLLKATHMQTAKKYLL